MIVRNPEEVIEIQGDIPAADTFDIILIFVRYYLLFNLDILGIHRSEYQDIILVEGKELLREIVRYLHELGWNTLSYYLNCLPSMRKPILLAESTSKILLYLAREEIQNFVIRSSSGRSFVVHSVFQDTFIQAGLGEIWDSFLSSGEYHDYLDLPDEFWEILLRKITGYREEVPTRFIFDFLQHLERFSSEMLEPNIVTKFILDLSPELFLRRKKKTRQLSKEDLRKMIEEIQDEDPKKIKKILGKLPYGIFSRHPDERKEMLEMLERTFDLRHDLPALNIYTNIYADLEVF